MLSLRPVLAGEHASLVPLLDAYAAEMRDVLNGDAGASGAAAAAMLEADLRAEVLLAMRDDQAVGFAIFFDLPEVVFARRCGALDDLFVLPAHRGQGIARALVTALAELGRGRRWSHLRWIVPAADRGAIALYERIAARSDWISYVIRLDPRASL